MYNCNCCNVDFKALDAKKISERILSVRVKCNSCKTDEDCLPGEIDILKHLSIVNDFEQIISKYNLDIPKDKSVTGTDNRKTTFIGKA